MVRRVKIVKTKWNRVQIKAKGCLITCQYLCVDQDAYGNVRANGLDVPFESLIDVQAIEEIEKRGVSTAQFILSAPPAVSRIWLGKSGKATVIDSELDIPIVISYNDCTVHGRTLTLYDVALISIGFNFSLRK